MFSHHDEVGNPGREDCFLEYPRLGQLGDVDIDCHVPISPLNPFFLFGFFSVWLDYKLVLYNITFLSTPTMSVGVQAKTEDVLVFFQEVDQRLSRGWWEVAAYIDWLVWVFPIDDFFATFRLYP